MYNNRLKIIANTWKSDPYELIDYSSEQLFENKIETQEEGFIFRNFNSIEFSKKARVTNLSEKLLDISRRDNNVKLILNDYKRDENENIISPNSAWFLLRKSILDDRMNQYSLNEGDIIKIGRITIKIKSIRFNNNSEKSNLNTKNLKEIKVEKNIKEINENHNNKVCKICYLEEDSIDNPLVQPCTCSGSMKYIHLKCLKKWLNTSIFIKIKNDENCNIYQCKPAECELCKTKFPDFIKHKGKFYEIFDFYNDFNNYIIIEILTLDKSKNKYMYIINLDSNNKIYIGRGHESNVVLNDISISRVHCFLTINNHTKKIYLNDSNSKFGTLVLVQSKNIILSVDLKLHLQIGRSYLSFLMKGNTNYFGCCGVSEKKNPDFYYFQNRNKNDLNYRTVKNESDMDFENKFNEVIIHKENKNEKEETVEKINAFSNINNNPNFIGDDLEELLLTPKKTIDNKNEEKIENNFEKYIENKNKEEEIIIINDSDDEDNDKNNNLEKTIDK